MEKHPRIPPEYSDIQVNFCKSPVCRNYGVPAEQTSVRGKNSYTLESRNEGISGCLCTACGEEFPLKSNLGIMEEVERMASYLSPLDILCCRHNACANYRNQVPVGTVGAYASFGKTAIGNPRWRCNVCAKTFSRNIKATARQRDHHKNKTIFKLLVNKMPVRRIIEVADIDPNTFYHRLDFLHRQSRRYD
jgi:transposase-like protein